MPSEREPRRLVLLFVDGIGLAPAGPDNPLAGRAMPHLARRRGQLLTSESVGRSGGWSLAPLDACLGVNGLPQSATGQTALFTGVNAAAELGRHVPALPGPRLQAILRDHSVFARLTSGGHRVTFANAFTEGYLARLRAGEVKASATTWSVLAATTELRVERHLEAGRAVPWDIVGDLFARRAGVDVGLLDPVEAGRRLASIASDHDLTLFETFLTDLAGHGRWGLTADEALRRVDGLIEGLLDQGGDDLTLALVSDHGNLEAAGHRRHTRHPVPWLLTGPLAERLQGPTSLVEVAPRLITALGDDG